MVSPLDTQLAELKRLLDGGVLSQATYDASVAALSAQLAGDGAIAQGPNAIAVGARGVHVGGDSHGDINLGVIINLGGVPGASAAALRRAYLARIVQEVDKLPLFVSDPGSGSVRLSSVYTALLTQRTDEEAVTRITHYILEEDELQRPTPRFSALDVLDIERKLVLMGGPGSGKSTFSNYVALCLCGEELGLPGTDLAALTAPVLDETSARESPERDPPPQRWHHGVLIPVQIVLRDLAAQLPAPGTKVTAETVWKFVAGRLEQCSLQEFAPLLKEELLTRGGLVLFDGLDEVPDAKARREQIQQAIQEFAQTFSRCRFLVTSRTYAYQRQDWKLAGFAEVELLPFTRSQIREFVDGWYQHMASLNRLTHAVATARARVLKAEIARNPRLRELAERPLLLTLIAQLQTEGAGVLPQKREELYDKAVEMLLDKWERLKVRELPDGRMEVQPSLSELLGCNLDEIRKQLQRLAFEAHRDQAGLEGTADISQAKLFEALARASGSKDAALLRAEDFLRDRAGILAEHGPGMYQFPHRSFQEYLAACHLTNDQFPDDLVDLARAEPYRWREVTLLAGAKAARGAAPGVWLLSETLCPAPVSAGGGAAADHWGALLAGRVLVESADLTHIAHRDREKHSRIHEWQCTLLRGDMLPAVERALAGQTLAVLGDPRPEVMRLDDMHFCYVPPGPFVMDQDDDYDSKPQRTIDLEYPYFIARFPVSMAQWREYLQRSGRAMNRQWSVHRRANEPVVAVSWHDAMRCCKYLTQAWAGFLPKGFIVTLPSEAEWNKAVRGGTSIPEKPMWSNVSRVAEQAAAPASTLIENPFPGRAFPWGHTFDPDKCNAEIRAAPSALGCYPAGCSPYGCEELCGSTLHWTRSCRDQDELDPIERCREDASAASRLSRVLLGGVLAYPHIDACSATRGVAPPNARNASVGFRLVLRATAVSV